jgi:hypothetical protein
MPSRTTLTYYSSVTPFLKHQALKKLLLLAAPGALFLVISALFIQSQSIGFIIFCSCLLMITWGLVPYRKIIQLERTPHKIFITKDTLAFFMKGREMFQIPTKDITKAEYQDDLKLYGIKAFLKDSSSLPRSHLGWHQQSKKIGCDLFFPYFRKNHAQEINNLSLGLSFSSSKEIAP